MQWLAVKEKDNENLFIQNRQEREKQLSVLIDEKITVDTLVVKIFSDYETCLEYCLKINSVSYLLNKIFN